MTSKVSNETKICSGLEKKHGPLSTWEKAIQKQKIKLAPDVPSTTQLPNVLKNPVPDPIAQLSKLFSKYVKHRAREKIDGNELTSVPTSIPKLRMTKLLSSCLLKNPTKEQEPNETDQQNKSRLISDLDIKNVKKKRPGRVYTTQVTFTSHDKHNGRNKKWKLLAKPTTQSKDENPDFNKLWNSAETLPKKLDIFYEMYKDIEKAFKASVTGKNIESHHLAYKVLSKQIPMNLISQIKKWIFMMEAAKKSEDDIVEERTEPVLITTTSFIQKTIRNKTTVASTTTTEVTSTTKAKKKVKLTTETPVINTTLPTTMTSPDTTSQPRMLNRTSIYINKKNKNETTTVTEPTVLPTSKKVTTQKEVIRENRIVEVTKQETSTQMADEISTADVCLAICDFCKTSPRPVCFRLCTGNPVEPDQPIFELCQFCLPEVNNRACDLYCSTDVYRKWSGSDRKILGWMGDDRSLMMFKPRKEYDCDLNQLRNKVVATTTRRLNVISSLNLRSNIELTTRSPDIELRMFDTIYKTSGNKIQRYRR